MAKRGPKTKYKKEYANIAGRVCAEFGADDKKLAKILGVSVATINNWKKDYPELLESIKKGKDEYDTENVEKSLLQKAMGFTKNKKYYSPDVTAQIFWLKNRKPDRWRDKQDIDLNGGNFTLILKDA